MKFDFILKIRYTLLSMAIATIPQNKLESIIREQKKLSLEMEKIKAGLRAFGFLGEFEKLSRWGRAFARRKDIKQRDILKND